MAATAHAHESTISVKKVHDARYLSHAGAERRHPHQDVSRGLTPNPVPLVKISRASSPLLHRLRVECGFTQEKMFLLGIGNSFDCSSCGFIEDMEHPLWNFASHSNTQEKLVRVARGPGSLCASVDDVLYPRGSRRSACVVFSALLNYCIAYLRPVSTTVFRLSFIVVSVILLIP